MFVEQLDDSFMSQYSPWIPYVLEPAVGAIAFFGGILFFWTAWDVVSIQCGSPRRYGAPRDPRPLTTTR